MKKQNSSIKAHLLWSALILLSLLAVCAIPFALAQSRSRGTTKRSQAASMSQLPTTSNVGAPASAIRLPVNPPAPAVPDAVLYDQMTNPAPTPGGVTSQDFETSFDAFDSFVPRLLLLR
jgi:hypothetical protein